MDKSLIDELALNWISTTEALIQSRESENKIVGNIASSKLDEIVYDDPEVGWLVINSARKIIKSERIMANLAAGPLENLVRAHAEKFIDRFEKLAKEDEDFAYLLSGVWLSKKLPPDLIARIERITKMTSRSLS